MKLKLYIYNQENEVVAVVEGYSNKECEEKAADAGYTTDDYGWTYSPAFGTVDGLKDFNEKEIL